MRNAAKPPAKLPTICYVTDGHGHRPADRISFLTGRIDAAVTAGADWVQIREKDLPAKVLVGLVREAVSASGRANGFARVIVNDRLDIAVCADAGGVHLAGDSLSAGEVSAWISGNKLSSSFLLGVSCHSVAEAKAAADAGADYIFFGPVFETPSKIRFGAPQGIITLAKVCSAVTIPVLAIGGIDVENALECLAAGASGVAAIRLFQETHAASELKRHLARIRRSAE